MKQGYYERCREFQSEIDAIDRAAKSDAQKLADHWKQKAARTGEPADRARARRFAIEAKQISEGFDDA